MTTGWPPVGWQSAQQVLLTQDHKHLYQVGNHLHYLCHKKQRQNERSGYIISNALIIKSARDNKSMCPGCRAAFLAMVLQES